MFPLFPVSVCQMSLPVQVAAIVGGGNKPTTVPSTTAPGLPADGQGKDGRRDGGGVEVEPEEEEDSRLQKPLILLEHLHSVFCTSLDSSAAAKDAIWQKLQLETCLGIQLNATWTKAVERSLEALCWRLYAESCSSVEKHIVYVADQQGAGGVKDKVLLVGAPVGLDLFFVGPVSTTPTAGSKRIASIGGIDFYVAPVQGPPSGDVLIPAWMARPIAKHDQTTLQPNTLTMEVWVTSGGEVLSEDPEKATGRERYYNAIVRQNWSLRKLCSARKDELVQLSGLADSIDLQKQHLEKENASLKTELAELAERLAGLKATAENETNAARASQPQPQQFQKEEDVSKVVAAALAPAPIAIAMELVEAVEEKTEVPAAPAEEETEASLTKGDRSQEVDNDDDDGLKKRPNESEAAGVTAEVKQSGNSGNSQINNSVLESAIPAATQATQADAAKQAEHEESEQPQEAEPQATQAPTLVEGEKPQESAEAEAVQLAGAGAGAERGQTQTQVAEHVDEHASAPKTPETRKLLHSVAWPEPTPDNSPFDLPEKAPTSAKPPLSIKTSITFHMPL